MHDQEAKMWRFCMRQLLILSVLLLGVTWAGAQNSAASAQKGSTTAGAHSHTVEGCLSSSNGKYTLTDMHGKAYELTGDTSKLAEHIGHEVKITGTESSSNPSASTTASGSEMALDVSSVTHISKTCKNAGAGMAH
jgi:formylglycine-generating enzyme required for sulfatase activity